MNHISFNDDLSESDIEHRRYAGDFIISDLTEPSANLKIPDNYIDRRYW